jgi:hypothetical protein
MSIEDTHETVNYKSIFDILSMIRVNNIQDSEVDKKLKEKIYDFFLKNTKNADKDKLSCVKDPYTRFRLRFFDFVGRVSQYDSESEESTILDFEDDESLASWFDPRRRLKPSKKSSSETLPIPTESENNVLCLLFNHTGNDPKTLDFPRAANIVNITKRAVDAQNKLILSEAFHKEETSLNSWRLYLGNVLMLRDVEKMTAEVMASIFYDSIAANVRDLKDVLVQHSYAYIFPCVTANEVACLLTVRTKSPLSEKDKCYLCKDVLPALSNLALLLSARILKAHTSENQLDLTRTYLGTQSRVIWDASHDSETRFINSSSRWYECDLANQTFGKSRLSTLKHHLTTSICIPIGDREIADSIRKLFLDDSLKDVLCCYGKSADRLMEILEAALDDEDLLRGIPKYRQHFIHSFHVFLTGLRYLIESPSNSSDSRPTPIEALAKIMDVGQEVVLKAWYCAAIFHDISYSVANVEEWVGFFLDRVILQSNKKAGEERAQKEQWVLNQIAHLFRFENYQDSFSRLVEAMAQYSNIAKESDGNMKLSNQVYTMLLGRDTTKIPVKSDHGILSALMFLNAFDRQYLNVSDGYPMKQFILLAADAIAHHNKPKDIAKHVLNEEKWHDLYQKPDSPKTMNPLRDLLIICDQIQQWGRTESEASEAYIDIMLSEWKWTLGGGSDELNIVLKYKAPVDSARYDKNKAKSFYDNIWKKNVVSDLNEYEKCFHVPFGSLSLKCKFDDTYFTEATNTRHTFKIR